MDFDKEARELMDIVRPTAGVFRIPDLKNALRKAHRAGQIDGLREAADIVVADQGATALVDAICKRDIELEQADDK